MSDDNMAESLRAMVRKLERNQLVEAKACLRNIVALNGSVPAEVMQYISLLQDDPMLVTRWVVSEGIEVSGDPVA